MEEKFLRKAVIEVGYGCNNNCIFCLQEKRKPTFFPPKLVMEKIARERERGANWLVLTGGEPTIHPAILDFVSFGKMLGYERIQVISNGRMFSSERFTVAMANAGLTETTISFHGPNPEIHDGLTLVPGSFEQAAKGVENCLKHGIKVSFNTALNSVNVKYIYEIIKMIKERFELESFDYDVIGTAPTGGTWRHKWLLPDHQEVKESLRKAIEYAENNDIYFWVVRAPIQDLPEGYQYHKEPWESHALDAVQMWGAIWREEKCPAPKCEYCEVEPICFYFKNLRKRLLRKRLDYIRGKVKEVPKFSRRFMIKDADDAEKVEEAGFEPFLRVEFDGLRNGWNEVEEKVKKAEEKGIEWEVKFDINRKSIKFLDRARQFKNVVFAPTNPYFFTKYEFKGTNKLVDTTGALMRLEEIKALGVKPLMDVPLCLGGDLEREYWIDTNSVEKGKLKPREMIRSIVPEIRVFEWKCWKCKLREKCPGFFGDYVKLFSFPELPQSTS